MTGSPASHNWKESSALPGVWLKPEETPLYLAEYKREVWGLDCPGRSILPIFDGQKVQDMAYLDGAAPCSQLRTVCLPSVQDNLQCYKLMCDNRSGKEAPREAQHCQMCSSCLSLTEPSISCVLVSVSLSPLSETRYHQQLPDCTLPLGESISQLFLLIKMKEEKKNNEDLSVDKLGQGIVCFDFFHQFQCKPFH